MLRKGYPRMGTQVGLLYGPGPSRLSSSISLTARLPLVTHGLRQCRLGMACSPQEALRGPQTQHQ